MHRTRISVETISVNRLNYLSSFIHRLQCCPSLEHKHKAAAMKFLTGFILGAVVGAKNSPYVLFYLERALELVRTYVGPTSPPQI